MDIIQEAKAALIHFDKAIEIATDGGRLAGIKYRDLLSRLVDRLEWKPIESAPKDGTVVWGCSIYSKRQGTMYWMEVEASVLKGHWSSIALCTDNPTHWMPLHLPPVGNS